MSGSKKDSLNFHPGSSVADGSEFSATDSGKNVLMMPKPKRGRPNSTRQLEEVK